MLYEDRDLKISFRQWLKSCHLHFDQEHTFTARQAPTGESDSFTWFNTLNIGKTAFSKGQLLKLRFRETMFAKVVGFRTALLPPQQTEFHGAGELVYLREPVQLFGKKQQVSRSCQLCAHLNCSDHLLTTQVVDIGRIDVAGSPVPEDELAPLIKRLPAHIKLWFDMDSYESQRNDHPIGKEFTVRAGSQVVWLRVQPRDGNAGKKQKAVFHRPT